MKYLLLSENCTLRRANDRRQNYLLSVTLGRQRAGSSAAGSLSFVPPLLSAVSVGDTFKLASSSNMPKNVRKGRYVNFYTVDCVDCGRSSKNLPSSLLFFFRIELLPGLVSCLDLSQSLTILFRRSGDILNLSWTSLLYQQVVRTSLESIA